MTPSRPDPPWEYLCQASDPSLQSFELSRLNHAANLRKEIAALVDQWLEETVAAMLARWLIERRRLVRDAGGSAPESLDPKRDLLREAATALCPKNGRRAAAV